MNIFGLIAVNLRPVKSDIYRVEGWTTRPQKAADLS
jgi:hypothetical protein